MGIKFYYFDIKGLGEATRLMFAYTGMAFEDKRVKFDEWPALKATMPNGQMPCLELEDGRKLAQMSAIARYVADINGLIPEDKFDSARSMEIAVGYTDVLLKVHCFLNVADEKKREFFNNAVDTFAKPRFSVMDGYFAQQTKSPWIFEKICWADFMVYNAIIAMEHFFGISRKDYPNLSKFYDAFTALPALQEHLTKYKDMEFGPINPLRTLATLEGKK